MHPEFFHHIAQRCRELMARTHSEFAREQLQLWVDEFEAQAHPADREPQGVAPPEHR